MRIRIEHATTYRYTGPTRSLLQVLRLTPRSFAHQHVAHWRVETDMDARLRGGEDALGNRIHTLELVQPVEALTLTVTGEVVTGDAQGLVSGVVERFPPTIFLRGTPLTDADAALNAFADETASQAGREPLARLHALMAAVKETIAFDTEATDVGTTAARAFAAGRGVCQDLTHIFIAGARRMGLPARYVSGHLARVDGVTSQEASHAWAEALVPDLGWVGFDPTNGVCPAERHVRVAIGLDYLGSAAVRGARTGGGLETLDVSLTVVGTAELSD